MNVKKRKKVPVCHAVSLSSEPIPDSEKKLNDSERQLSEIEQIDRTGSAVTHSRHGAIQCVTIIGQVEGHYQLGDNAKVTRYEQILPLLAGVEESEEIAGLILLLNTVGGDVEAGLAIAELIAGMSKPTVSLVLGGGHSIGVPLAVSAKRSFIVPSATMTVHPVRTNGLVLGVPQSFAGLKKMQERINGFILQNSRIERKTLVKLLSKTDEIATDVGSVLNGNEAVSVGLIDEVGGLSAALGWLHRQIDSRLSR